MILPWLGLLLGAPVVAALAGLTALNVRRLRLVGLACAGIMLAAAALPAALPQLRSFALSSPPWGPLPALTLRMDALSAVLPALAAALWLLSVLVTPRMLLDRGGLTRNALATAFTALAFLTPSPLVLFISWTASVILLRQGARGSAPLRRHQAMTYLYASVVLFGLGAAVVTWAPGPDTPAGITGLCLLTAAALIRKGIFPFHAWVPALFEHEPLGPAILFCAPQVGTWAVAALVLPQAPPGLLRWVAILSLATAVYAAAMALVQRSARRACAYLFTSQSALVLAGLDVASVDALTGALILWISSSLAFAGLARCVLVLEARRGRLDLGRHHGGYERKPLLAVSFLLLGLSLTGFPGTLGFVGEELLLGGAVEGFPVLGFLVVVSGALTGLAVLRMYFSLFCGSRGGDVPLEMRPREAAGFLALVALLLATGLAPSPLVRSRMEASAWLLAPRGVIEAPASPPAGGAPR